MSVDHRDLTLWRAMAAGGVVWTIYGVAYFFYFYVGGVAIQFDHVALTSLQATVVTSHLPAYFVFGALASAGVWSGLRLIGRRPRGADSGLAVGTASLLLTLLASIATISSGSRNDIIAFCVFVLLMTAVLARTYCWRRLAWLASVGEPWAVCFIATGIPWVWSRMHSPRLTLRIGVAVAALVAWMLTAWLLARILERWRGLASQAMFVRRSAVMLTAVGMISAAVLGAWLVRGADPIRVPPVAAMAGDTRPNIVIVVMDTVRAANVSFLGYERDTTPFLKRLAERATVFTHAVATSNMTLPTHASLLTGQYPRRHGSHYDPPAFATGRPLPRDADTLAELLAAKGYRTGAVVANYLYLDRAWGMAQGFEAFDDRHFLRLTSSGDATVLASVIAHVAPWALPSGSWRDFRRGEVITAEATRLADALGRDDSPFFLLVNYMDAHHPYVPPAPFDARFPGNDIRVSLFDFDRLARDVTRGTRTISARERTALMAAYDGGIAYVDRQIESLVAHLDARGELDNTLFIVTSDHGEAFGSRGLVGHGLSTSAAETRIPLLVKFPGAAARRRVVDEWVSQVDVMPTALAAAGIAVPPDVDGIDLSGAVPPRAVVAEAFRSPNRAEVGRSIGHPETAVFFRDHKLVIRSNGDQLVFDLVNDPHETRDLFAPDEATAQALDARLGDWLARVPRFDPTGRRIDSDTVDRLKSLGYIR